MKYTNYTFMVPWNMHEKVFLLIKFFEGVLFVFILCIHVIPARKSNNKKKTFLLCKHKHDLNFLFFFFILFSMKKSIFFYVSIFMSFDGLNFAMSYFIYDYVEGTSRMKCIILCHEKIKRLSEITD